MVRRLRHYGANNEANNAWAWVNGIRWHQCDWRNNTTNLLILAAYAKENGRFLDFNEDGTLIIKMYVW